MSDRTYVPYKGSDKLVHKTLELKGLKLHLMHDLKGIVIERIETVDHEEKFKELPVGGYRELVNMLMTKVWDLESDIAHNEWMQECEEKDDIARGWTTSDELELQTTKDHARRTELEKRHSSSQSDS